MTDCLPLCRRGLLAYVYNGVSLTKNALVAGTGSYIVRLSVRDLHGPTNRWCKGCSYSTFMENGRGGSVKLQHRR